MIEKLNDYGVTMKPLVDKINEIIDWINNQNNEQQDWQPNEMQNGFVEEKPWQKKLEEAENFIIDYWSLNEFNRHYSKCNDYENTVIALKGTIEGKIQLYKQVIEELIKENEWKEHQKNIYKNEAKRWKDYCNELKNKL